MNLSAIRQGLAANLAAVFLPDYQVTAYLLSSPTPPGFMIMPDRIDFHEQLQSGELLRLIVVGHVGFTTDLGAQDNLDALLIDAIDVSDPLSVRQALELDQRLTSRLNKDGTITTGQAAACDDVTVTMCSGYREYGMQGSQQMVLGAWWTVEVRT